MEAPLERVARWRIPASTPTTLVLALPAGMARWTSTVKETNQRSAVRLMVAEDPDPRELHVLAVVQHFDGAGGEPAGIPAASLPFLVRETDRATLAAAGS